MSRCAQRHYGMIVLRVCRQIRLPLAKRLRAILQSLIRDQLVVDASHVSGRALIFYAVP